MDPLFPQPSLDGLAVLVKVTRAPPLSSSFHIHRMARSPLLTLIPRLPACLTALGCCLLGSCHPYQENPPYRPTPRTLPRPAPAVVAAPAPVAVPTVIPAAPVVQPKAQPKLPATPPATAPEHRAQATTVRPQPLPASQPTAAPPPKRPSNPAVGKPPSVAPNAEWPVANPAPGKPGYVLSPYNHKLILVRGIPSGAVVPDPATPDSDKKYFRVP